MHERMLFINAVKALGTTLTPIVQIAREVAN
jgi:hypothetical protein